MKIDSINPVNFSEKEIEVLDYIKNWIGDLVPFKYDNDMYTESLFYMKPDGRWILEKDNQSQKLRVRSEFIDELFIGKLLTVGELNNVIFYMLKKLHNVDIEDSFYLHSMETKSPTIVEKSFMKKNNIIFN